MGSCMSKQCLFKTNVIDHQHENQTVSKENQPMFQENQPMSQENQPVFQENQPVSQQNQPASREIHPASREIQPPPQEIQPASQENRPTSRQPPRSSLIFSIISKSRLQGGMAFMHEWRRRNALLPKSEIITQAANGILTEGRLLGQHNEAQELANDLLAMKDKNDVEILKRCIYLYTLESFLYRTVNKVLIENDKTKMDTVAPFCYFLTEAIWSDTLNHERFYGEVYRAMQLDPNEIQQYAQAIGTYNIWYGFVSTSKGIEVAKNFGNCLFIIDLSDTGGLTISSYSNHPDENEVILPPGTTLRIDGVELHHDRPYIYAYAIPEFRLILLGGTGTGKSALGNTILGKKDFKELPSARSVTRECEIHDRILGDARLLVVDTPGFFDTELRPVDLIPEICCSYQVAAPGPHAFVIVFSLKRRFTLQEEKIVEWIRTVFDERALDYCIIVFTGLDAIESQNRTIQEYLQEVPDFLADLLQRCGGRYIAVDNRASDVQKEENIQTLLYMMKMMVKINGGQYYNNKTFIKITEHLQQHQTWFDPTTSRGTVNLIDGTAKIVSQQVNVEVLFKNQT